MNANERKIKSFLSKFGNKDTVLVNVSSSKVSSMMPISIRDIKNYNSNISQKDVYFVVNEGGNKINHISKIHACFVDLDAGRNSKKEYLSFKQVTAKKAKMLKRINEFPVKPSLVVSTRNGYQVYWLIEPITAANTIKVNWSALQKKIAGFFKDVGADPKANKLNQLFRVPYTYWRKPWEGKEPYYVFVASDSKLTYTFEKLMDATKHLSPNVKINNSASAGWAKAGIGKKAYGVPTAAKYYSTVQALNSQSNQSADQRTELLLKIRDFLNEVNKSLYFSGNKFSAKMAKELSEELSKEFCI